MPFDPLEIANDAPDERTFERETLDALARTIGYDAAFFATKGAPSTTRAIDSARLDAALARVDYADELAPVRAAALARRGVAIDTEVLGERRVRASRYHRDFAAKMGGRSSLLGFLSVRGRPIGGLMLGRCSGSFSDRERAEVEELLPALAFARASFRTPWPGAPLPMPRVGLGRALLDRVRREVVHERDHTRAPALTVRDRAGYREMVADDARGELVWSRAALDEPERSGWFYVDLLHLAAVRASWQRRFLLVGVGGGVVARQLARLYPGADMCAVESDPRVVGLARRWFGLGAIPGLSVTVEDGAAFLRSAPREAWDAIVVDAYDGSELAGSLATRAFFADVRRALRPGGGVAFNVIGALAGRGDVARVERAAQLAGLHPRLVPVLDPGEAYAASAIRNVVLIGRR